MLNWVETQKDKSYSEQVSTFSSNYWSDGKVFASLLAPLFPEEFSREKTDVYIIILNFFLAIITKRASF